jgi:hypothetical protein
MLYSALKGQKILFTGAFCLTQAQMSELAVKHGATTGKRGVISYRNKYISRLTIKI